MVSGATPRIIAAMKRRPVAWQLFLVVLAFVGMLVHASIEPQAEPRHTAHQTLSHQSASQQTADISTCPLCARGETAGAMCAVACAAMIGFDLASAGFVPHSVVKVRLSPVLDHSLTEVAVLPDAPPPKAFLTV
jgi:hypothetical protein